jgi:hypothetical protein
LDYRNQIYENLIGLFAIATLAFGQTNPRTANPERFRAADVRADGDITHLRGNVLMKIQSAIIHAEDADLDAGHYSVTIRGDSQWDVLPVHYLDPNDPLSSEMKLGPKAQQAALEYLSWLI